MNKTTLSIIFLLSQLIASVSSAQTTIEITGAHAGFPIAIPKLCITSASGGELANNIPNIIRKNLKLTGLFEVIDSKAFIQTEPKCSDGKEIAFSDWSVIGAEGLVQGELEVINDVIYAKLYLYDVIQKRAVLGKRYEADSANLKEIAHRFSNEIYKYFTGEEGIFGTKLAYIAKVGRFKELFTMDLDGTNVKQITDDKGLAVSPSWSLNNKYIIYTSYRSRRPELYLIRADGSRIRQVTKRDGLELGAEFAPGGKEIVASASVYGITDIVMFDLKGKLLKKITNNPSIDVSPSWSPDGEKIAFCSNRGGGPQIYTMNKDGSNVKRISFVDSRYCTSPSWSPKGDKIAYVCQTSGNQIFVSDLNSRQATQVTFAGINEDPTWSSDSKYILFSSNFARSNARNLAIMPLATGIPTQITFERALASQPAWSFKKFR